MKKFEAEFRKDHPETIGETDQAFDTLNYSEWLEERLEQLTESNYTILEDQSKTIKELKQSLEQIVIAYKEGIAGQHNNYIKNMYHIAEESLAKHTKAQGT